MPDEKPNPLVQHLMKLVDGRQQSEVAKIALLHEISNTANKILAELTLANEQRAELVERARAK